MKRSFGCCALLVLGLALLAGCGSSDETTSAAETSAPAEATASSEVEDKLKEVEAEKALAEEEAKTVELKAKIEASEAKAAAKKAKAAKQAQEAKAAKAAKAEAKEEVQAEEAESAEPPNVVGLPLPAATSMMKEAGFKILPENTDTLLGIVDPSNYTVCTQDPPRGNNVVVLAQKYGC